MNEETLQEKARSLRFEPDEVMIQRLRSRVAERLARQDSFWDLLSAWTRPVAAVLALLALILGFALMQLRPSAEDELLASVHPQPAAEEVYIDIE